MHEAALSKTLVDLVQMQEFERNPLILERGEGVWVWDQHGRKIMDSISGVFVVNLGHQNRRVIDAIDDQHGRIAFASPTMSTNERMLELAETIDSLTPPGMTTAKFHSGGSEAIEAAIKAARQYHLQSGSPGKYKVISRYGAYHGATFGALSATGIAMFRTPFEPLAPGFVHVPPPHAPGGIGSLEAMRYTIEAEGPDTIAAVILEPVMNMAGAWEPPLGYLEGVRDLCDQHGIVLIYDEIVTAFGRLGEWFGADHFGVWPDISCVGKGITGGYAPLSAAIMRDHIAESFRGTRESGRMFRHGITYGGNPISCSAALAVIAEISDRSLLDAAKQMGKRLSEGLSMVATGYEFVTGIRATGLLVAVDFDLPAERLGRLGENLRSQAFLSFGPYPSGVMRLAPPLTITPEEVDQLVEMVAAGLRTFVGTSLLESPPPA
ncbi:MAG: aminotransferase class III-fold pyridoxal phosphate-dependent enzyme [Actinobacteria bacterium]|nr:aminotransferase class III-fold pyridoxal phosphate-dependent enzyme [Actinomycetota bacterium]